MNKNCVICVKKDKGSINTLNLFINDIKDYEYGVKASKLLYKCNSCGLISIHPNFQSNELLGLYPENYSSYLNKSHSKSLISHLQNFINNREAIKVSKLIPKNGTILEVGCGNGLFLESVVRYRPDINLIGFDIKETEFINKELIDFYVGEFENYQEELESCDLIYFSNLIEHVINPNIFLDKCNSLLKHKGIVYGVTPSHNSIDRKIFKKFWGGYHYPRHLNIFNDSNIVTLLNLSNFKLIKVSGSYGFWYISIANFLFPLHGYKKRGILFAFCSLIFLPIDILINLFFVTGSMTFIGQKVE